MSIPRLRMFAGPNGSGKSTIKSVLSNHLLGHYLNPDDIQREVERVGYYSIKGFGINTNKAEIITFFSSHPLFKRINQSEKIDVIEYNKDDLIDFSRLHFNAYLSAILTDFLRQKMIQTNQSFSFETVMSSQDKLQTLHLAQQTGFRTYLYYVATEDPIINLSRIQHRIREGGHSVPEDKVVERYFRSLELLLSAIRFTNRAYLFDNSGGSNIWIAEITEGKTIEFRTKNLPAWVKRYVLDKLKIP